MSTTESLIIAWVDWSERILYMEAFENAQACASSLGTKLANWKTQSETSKSCPSKRSQNPSPCSSLPPPSQKARDAPKPEKKGFHLFDRMGEAKPNTVFAAQRKVPPLSSSSRGSSSSLTALLSSRPPPSLKQEPKEGGSLPSKADHTKLKCVLPAPLGTKGGGFDTYRDDLYVCGCIAWFARTRSFFPHLRSFSSSQVSVLVRGIGAFVIHEFSFLEGQAASGFRKSSDRNTYCKHADLLCALWELRAHDMNWVRAGECQVPFRWEKELNAMWTEIEWRFGAIQESEE